jgi:hypothetical protein
MYKRTVGFLGEEYENTGAALIINIILKKMLRNAGYEQFTVQPKHFDKADLDYIEEYKFNVWKGF